MFDITTEELDRLELAWNSFIRIVKKPIYWEEIQHQAKVNIDRPAAAILHILSKQDCQFQSLVNQLGLEAPSVSRKVHELENNGLILRRPNTDKRIHELRLSPEAEIMVKQLTKAKRLIMSKILSNWSVNERQELITILQRLSNDMSDYFDHKKLNER